MSATLRLAREAFIKGLNRDTAHSERPRMIAVLDAIIAWSVARPTQLRFRADDNDKGVVRFERIGSNAVMWSAAPRRNDSPVLEFLPGASRLITPEERASAIGTLSAFTREPLDPAGRVHIGFGALKNSAACAATLALLGELVEKTGRVNHSTAGTA
jgi:hypothetical protein